MRLIAWMVFTMSLIAAAQPAGALTREELLKGCAVPERRAYPLSSAVKPCDDFYKYVCSEAEAGFKLPDNRSYWSFSFTDAAERVLCARKQYFKSLAAGYVPKAEHAHGMKDFYLACMDEPASRAEERRFVQAEVAKIMALKSAAELAELAAARIDTAKPGYLGFQPLPDQDDPSRYDVLVEADLQSLPEPSYYQKPDVVKSLTDVAAAVLKAAGVDRPAQRAQWAVGLESRLAAVYPAPAVIRQRVASNTYIGRGEWAAKYPHLLLGRFLARLPATTRTRDLIPESLAFFDKAVQEAPLEQLRSALLFHAAKGYMDDAYPAVYAKQFAFNHKFLGGPAVRPDRQERCTKEISHRFGMELDEDLSTILFPEFPQERVTQLAGQIRESMVRGLEANRWLSDGARLEAKRKVATARMFLVKPQVAGDWNFQYPAAYRADSPYRNRELWQDAWITKALDEVAKPRSQSRWDMAPLTINAFYSPPDNKFVMLEGILQYPFFDPAMSPVESLGAIGAVIGHELGHGIDDSGSRYDADGKLRQWMTMDDMATFGKHGAVFVEQFDKIGHNGKLTLGENIGDHVGLSFAFAAAFPDPAAAVPADKQKFFEAYGRLWCGVMRPEFRQMLLKTDPHAMGYARANEQVVHQAGFYEAFQCKAGDKMYLAPDKRVSIW